MRSVKVLLWGSEVGLLSENPNNPHFFLFKYNDQFIDSHIEVCPFRMPLNKQVYNFDSLNLDSFKGLPPLLVDSLPDRYGEALLSIWKEKNNKEKLDSIDVLSYIGKRGIGALEFEPSYEVASKEEKLEVESLVKVAKAVLYNREKLNFNIKKEEDLQKLIDVGSSIGGARAKAVIAIDSEGNIKSGQIANLKGYTYCILKFDGTSLGGDNEPTYYTRIEYSYYLMATSCGINMANCFLLKRKDHYHFVTKRFDRGEQGEKIHMLSLAGIAGFDYKKPGENSYEEVAVILKRIGCGYDDVYQLYKRMVFNYLSKNNDDHVKNISFLMDKNGVWRLAPAYDLSFSYNPNGEWTKYHQMRINGKVDDVTYRDLLSSAQAMGIKKAHAETAIETIKDAINNYDVFAEKAFLPKEVTENIKKHFPTI